MASLCGHGDAQRGDGGDGGGAGAALEQRALADHGAGAQLGEGLAVDVDADHAVEHQVELVAGLALAGQLRALLEVADLRALRRPA